MFIHFGIHKFFNDVFFSGKEWEAVRKFLDIIFVSTFSIVYLLLMWEFVKIVYTRSPKMGGKKAKRNDPIK